MELVIEGKVLGKGGFGVVRLGEWSLQKVAVKEMEIEKEDWQKIE